MKKKLPLPRCILIKFFESSFICFIYGDEHWIKSLRV